MTSSEPSSGTPEALRGAVGERLARIARGQRIAPAYLFESGDAHGPREAARWFAAALLCDARPGEGATGGAPPPCGVCSSCRRVRSGNHPDWHRRGRDKATVISVEALVPLLERAHASPREGRRQVFVVEPAEAMAPEAVARYLKTLEEPPPTTTFVLISTRPDRLPDAVLSRCQRLRFPDPSADVLARRLASEGVEPARARVVAAWAGGSTARARRLAALEADVLVPAFLDAAASPAPRVGAAAEATLAAIRSRTGAAGAGDVEVEEREAGDAAPEGAAGERVRQGLDDLFYAILTMLRDRLAGRDAPSLPPMDPTRVQDAVERIGRLSTFVRRNVSPAALLLDAAYTLRRGGLAG